jgi:hypothetical protein
MRFWRWLTGPGWQLPRWLTGIFITWALLHTIEWAVDFGRWLA